MNENIEGGEQSTVLVVDDERATADIHTEFLIEDHVVRTAYSGEEALELVTPDIDVVLLDRRMPGVSGDEVLETIRERNLDCRVVMVTAIDPDIDVLDLPFDDYLVKPVSSETIRDAVSRMLARNACDDAIREVMSLASRMATIESKLTIQDLEASSKYAALEARLAELREGLDVEALDDDAYAEFTTEKIQMLFA